MTDSLTASECKALAEKLAGKVRNQAFINGEFTPAASGRTYTTTNPATGAVITDVAGGDAADIDRAVLHARKSFEDGVWSKRSPSERKTVLLKFAALLEADAASLAVLESLDSGKPVGECLALDVPDTINTIRWHAELIDKIYDSTAPSGSDAMTLVVREPIGVVGCVLPWNFPLMMIGWKIGPALAAGCSLIVKPAEDTSLTALRVAELAYQAGIPAGVFNVVPGLGAEAGAALGLHNDVDMVTFTGSTQTGKRFLRYAADSNLKRVVLECGGKNPAVVLKDAPDLSVVASHIVNGAFWNMGENCSATSRLIVHASLKDELLKHVIEQISSWKMGDPLDPSNQLGELVNKTHFEKVASYLDIAKQEGLKVLTGGKTQEGVYVEPTIIDKVTPESKLFREEIFGPVLTVTTFETVEEAIRLANDTSYGLAASVYTENLSNAVKVSRAIRAGCVTVNCFGEGDAGTPFGGYKQSGFGGRDKSIFAHDQYTEIKTIWFSV
ncbi:aldehyde dehydrogenase [Acetobacter cibinongensis]|uniref:Aldehyde dehydrogenase n=1 Tax=Acetobacter cibinongensis TaxID=146475 RepID=A0A1Z5YX37_9PROT|nr:aldehyde dehydrogenase [Acetobacter cibinongensis]OUJ03896.1 aldehyde dehydrogenase [Acetobacter cibinongensis]